MSPTGGLPGRLLLLAVILLAVGFFTWRTVRLVGLVRSGAPDDRTADQAVRVRRFATMVLGHSKLLQKPAIGAAHFLIFWGFIILTVGTVQILLSGLFPGFQMPLVGGTRYFAIATDVVAALVLLAVLYAAYRRLVQRPWHLTTEPDAFIILGLIAGLMITIFLTEGFASVAFGGEEEGWSPSGRTLVALFSWAEGGVARVGYVGSWWAHVLLVLGFLAYLPLSKHLHIVAAPFAIYFQTTRPKGELLKIENIEEAEHFGVNNIMEFKWKDLLDTYACTECGRCTSVCPATLTGKPLDPKNLIIDLKGALYAESGLKLAGHRERADRAEHEPLVGGVIKDDVLWSCTTCMACIEACPVGIEHVPKIVDMRRALVLEESRFPPEATPVFNSLERHGNPFGFRADTRADWADGLDVHTLGVDPEVKVDVLYWVGCYGSFDERNKKVARSLARVLKSAGVNFGILGVEETCTGDPARRLGNEYLFQVLAEGAIETLKSYGVQTIVTACPHCMNNIKNEYGQFGGDFEVVHHSQYIRDLLKSGKLRLEDGFDKRSITFHDPCYLGRYNDVYDQPREVLQGLGGAELIEMKRSRNKALCCGGGGGRTFLEENLGSRMSHNRLKDVLDTGAETLAAGCPYCITMFEDGIRSTGAEDRVQVEDIAELVAARLPRDAAT